MKTFLSVVFCLSFGALSAHGQIESNRLFTLTPYNPKGSYNTYGLKFMPLLFPLGDGGGTKLCAGFEYGFHKAHSVAVDGEFHFMYGSHDQVTDTAGTKYDIGNYYHSNDAAIILSYRYYLNWSRQRVFKSTLYYVSGFIRYSSGKGFRDPTFKNDFVVQRETQRSIGVLFGRMWQFDENPRLWFEVNAGVFYKGKIITTEYLEQSVLQTRHEYPSNLGLRIGLNFQYCSFRRKQGR